MADSTLAAVGQRLLMMVAPVLPAPVMQRIALLVMKFGPKPEQPVQETKTDD